LRYVISVTNYQLRLNYEALFGVVEYIGEFSEDFLINMFSSILSKDSLNTLVEDFKKRKIIRVYASGEDLLRMLKSLNIKLEENILNDYEYVLVLEPVAAS